MERVSPALKNKIMTAEQAAQLVRTGMTIGVSGFTSVGYPKAVPLALAASGHARELTPASALPSGMRLTALWCARGL